MNKPIELTQLLRLRKVTRALEEHFRGQLDAHLQSLQPLFRPANVLGDYVRNAPKQTVKIADASFKELRSLYLRVGRVKPFRFEEDIRPPIDVFGGAAELSPVTYKYEPKAEQGGQAITVTSPLRWVLSYKGMGPHRLRELLTSRTGTARLELQVCLLHFLVLHVILRQEQGVVPILRAMRFDVTTDFVESLGGLPLTYVSAPVRTMLPDEEVMIQSTEVSGSLAFEEIVDMDSVSGLKDPVKDALTGLIRGFGDDMLEPDDR